MQQRHRLLALLADGRFHSGEELGPRLGIGRSGVWKLVRSLEDSGLDIFAVRGKGYRLSEPLDLLNREQILAAVDAPARRLIGALEVLPEIDSTNRYLVDRCGGDLAEGHCCFAEYQSAGKGRRGRAWVSPPAANIYLSIYRSFDSTPALMQGLSLAVGVAVVRALTSLGVVGLTLKWPNDVMWEGRKLGGILLEMSGESAGPWRVITGLGLNVNMPAPTASSIDQPWTDLRVAAGRHLGRNRIAGRVLQYMVTGLDVFAREGFVPFRREWEGFDSARGRPVAVTAFEGVTRGLAQGVDETGALLVLVDGELRRFLSGDVSLRVDP